MQFRKLELAGNLEPESMVMVQTGRASCGRVGKLVSVRKIKRRATSMDENLKVVRNDNIPAGEVDGELVALDLEKGNCFGMDRIGAAIWELAAKPVTIGEIADSLTASHDVEREQCLADVAPFIDDLLAEGLLLRS